MVLFWWWWWSGGMLVVVLVVVVLVVLWWCSGTKYPTGGKTGRDKNYLYSVTTFPYYNLVYALHAR